MEQRVRYFGPWRQGVLAVLAVLVSILASIFPVPVQAAAQPLRLADLNRPGAAPNLAGRPTILVLWRSDCGPCLVELGHLRELEAAAGPARLALVSLDTPKVARAKLKAMGLAPRYAWLLRDDPASTLARLGGGPPRLPLSAAYDTSGRPCGLRIGLLGLDQVRGWARSCS